MCCAVCNLHHMISCSLCLKESSALLYNHHYLSLLHIKRVIVTATKEALTSLLIASYNQGVGQNNYYLHSGLKTNSLTLPCIEEAEGQ